jgi:hypothetical protein
VTENWSKPRKAQRTNKMERMMTDEASLNETATRGVRAEGLLNNELLSEAFTALEGSYVSAWRASAIDDSAGREKLFLAINVIGKVRDHLASVVANGKLAQAELKELAQITERRRRFGIL